MIFRTTELVESARVDGSSLYLMGLPTNSIEESLKTTSISRECRQPSDSQGVHTRPRKAVINKYKTVSTSATSKTCYQVGLEIVSNQDSVAHICRKAVYTSISSSSRFKRIPRIRSLVQTQAQPRQDCVTPTKLRSRAARICTCLLPTLSRCT